jgi:large conductance mechanosensitive channel
MEAEIMWKQFKEFAMRGNVIDLAVGVIIGGAFGKIVGSLVNDLLMPVIGSILGGVSFTDLKWVITPAVGEIAEVAIRYGSFIQAVVDFLIIAFSMFMVIQAMNATKKKEVKVPPAPPAPSKESVLLEEIRDLLKQKA